VEIIKFPHFDGFVDESFLDTEVQARFSFSDERQTSLARCAMGNQTRRDGRPTHHTLLGAFPSIWVRKDKFAGRLEVFPELDTVEMCLFDVLLCTLI